MLCAVWATQLRLRVSWRMARWDTWRQDTWAAGPLAAAAHMAGSRGRVAAAAAAVAVAVAVVVAALSAALGGVAARPGFAPALQPAPALGPAPAPAGSVRPAPGIDMDRIACRTIFFNFVSGKCAGCLLLRDEMSDRATGGLKKKIKK